MTKGSVEACIHDIFPISCCTYCRVAQPAPSTRSTAVSSAPTAEVRTGAARPPAGALRTQPPQTCPACNAEIRSTYSFCRSCKHRLRRAATSTGAIHTAPWTYVHALRPWQVTALAAWEQADHRGVVEAATGTGKTAVAFAAVQRLRVLHGENLRVAIVVPTKVLARQWRRALTSECGVPPYLIGDQYSSPEVEWTPRHPVLITVLDTARTHLSEVIGAWKDKPILLVVDECHRAGSESNARIFGMAATYTLGLSATPERDDGGHRKYVFPGLGGPVFRYPLLNALDDGVLAPLVSVNLYVDFTVSEQAQWDDLRHDIADAIRLLEHYHPELETAGPEFLKIVTKLAEQEDPTAMRLMSRLTSRQKVLASAQGRVACQRKILEWLATVPQRALVLHETIRAAEASHRALKDANVTVALDHSQLPRQERDNEEATFRAGRARVYVAVRTLDEGVDVPDAAVAVIAAGSRSLRQRIQRFGRVLRYEKDKSAIVISVHR